MRLIFKVLSFLPLVILHAVGWSLGWLVYGLSPTYRARLRANSALAGISICRMLAKESIRRHWTWGLFPELLIQKSLALPPQVQGHAPIL